MKQVLKSLVMLLFLSSCGNEISPKTLWHDHKAREALKAERYEDALLRYFQLLENDGDRFNTHSNIGVLLFKLQKPEDALKSLQHALKLAAEQKDPAGLFAVNFNLGVYYGAQKKVKEALESYQAALEINPASKETKTNIELLIQQQQQEQEGDGESQPDDKGDKGQNDKEKQDDSKGDQKDKNNPKDGEGDEEKKQDQPRQQSPKYQPRPFKGDQLSEGDVKKILGELKNQEQKIRANFDKNEKGKSRDNEKDW